MIHNIFINCPITQYYLDGMLGDQTIMYNYMVGGNRGVYVNGGKYNKVAYNRFNGVKNSLAMTNEITWVPEGQWCDPGGPIELGLKYVNYSYPPWSIAFPFIGDLLNHVPCQPT